MPKISLELADVEDLVQIQGQIFHNNAVGVFSDQDLSGLEENIYTIVIDSRIAGAFNFARYKEGDFCYVEVFVDPEYRGKWFGNSIVKQMKTIGFDILKCRVLYAVSKNDKAIKLIEKAGFKFFTITKDGNLYRMTRKDAKWDF